MEQRVEISASLEGLAERLGAVATDASDMQALGQDALAIIYNRTTREHLDVFGKPFKAYSTFPTWFSEGDDYYSLARKAGGKPAKVGPNIRGKRKKGKSGKRYVFFAGGYQQFHAGLYGDTRPNLMKTQEMLGSGHATGDGGIGVSEVTENTVLLEFTRPRERQKAQWNEDNGREFWGIGKRPGEAELLGAVLKERLEARVEAALNGNAE